MSAERDELLRALDGAITGLLAETHEIREFAMEVESQLRDLAAA
jgi:hypothetical protein